MIDSTFDLYSLDTSHTGVIKNGSRYHLVFFGSKVIPKENNYSRAMWVLPLLDGGGGVAPIVIIFFSWAGKIPQKRVFHSPTWRAKAWLPVVWWLVREKPEICTIKPFQGECIKVKVSSQNICSQKEQSTKHICWGPGPALFTKASGALSIGWRYRAPSWEGLRSLGRKVN